MQQGYVHAILKLPRSQIVSGKRMAIIFRNGKEYVVPQDTGTLLSTADAPDRTIEYQFGSMVDDLTEGERYFRTDLQRCGAHASDRAGVAGNADVGCPSIVVNSVSQERGEMDGFQYVRYYAGPTQRSGALFTSFLKNKPVRVFRSSEGMNGPYHPPRKEGRVVYRYDGVYYIIRVTDLQGLDFPRSSPRTKDGRVFFLVRAEPREVMHHLKHAYDDIWPFHHDECPVFNKKTSQDVCEAYAANGAFQLDPYLAWLKFKPNHLMDESSKECWDQEPNGVKHECFV